MNTASCLPIEVRTAVFRRAVAQAYLDTCAFYRVSLGYTLDELKNEITGGATPASFEPSIDYVVTKVPRFAFEKFPQADSHLTTQMK